MMNYPFRILHVCHGLWGPNNGVDIYLRNFIRDNENENFIVVPEGKNINSDDLKDIVFEVKDLHDIRQLAFDLNIDFVLLHWTGQESAKENDDLVRYKNGIVSLSGKKFSETQILGLSKNSFVDVALLWNDDEKPNIILISHACYSLPKYLNNSVIDCIVHVSYEAYQVNKFIDNNHYVIYPCLKPEFENLLPVNKSEKIRIGWLGRLNKYDWQVYDFLKKTYSKRNDLQFIFSGAGKLDKEPPENFIFTGNIESTDFFKNIDIFLYPTTIDSFSISFLEAMSQAKPCIVSPVVKELKQIGKAYLYPDLITLEACLNALIGSKELRDYLGNQSRRKALKFFLNDIMKDNFNKLFNYFHQNRKKLLKTKGRKPLSFSPKIKHQKNPILLLKGL